MPGRLVNKVAIVTGASSGLGRAVSILFAKEGAHVVCADLTATARNDTSIKTTHDLVKENGGKSIFIQLDVSDAKSMENLVTQTVQEFGRLDIMVNNAGVGLEAKLATPLMIWETPDETFDTTMRINVRSVFLGCKYAAAQMIKQEPHPSGDRGWIINTASIFGLISSRGVSSYSTSKGAVVNLTRAAALELTPYRVHCNAICPGFTKTAMIQDIADAGGSQVLEHIAAAHPFKGLGEPEDVAKAMLFLASEDASWVTGVALPVDGAYTAQ